MWIEPHWRVATIGDGDLSFSRALIENKRANQVVATVYDSFDELSSKYGSEHCDWLVEKGVSVYHQIDVCDPSSIPKKLRKQFDLVIFQFPLIAGFPSEQAYRSAIGQFSTNTLNRALIFNFLTIAQRLLLASDGAQLCYVTSKDVKPYSDWNIENMLDADSKLNFAGQKPFDSSSLSGYRVRNVNKDNFVKDTQGTTYAWSGADTSLSWAGFEKSLKHSDEYCSLCGDGPFDSEDKWQRHNSTKQHVRRSVYEDQWQNYLKQHGLSETGPE